MIHEVYLVISGGCIVHRPPLQFQDRSGVEVSFTMWCCLYTDMFLKLIFTSCDYIYKSWIDNVTFFNFGAYWWSRVSRTIDPRWPDTLKILPMQVLRVTCGLSICIPFHLQLVYVLIWMLAIISNYNFDCASPAFPRAISNGCSTSTSFIEEIAIF